MKDHIWFFGAYNRVTYDNSQIYSAGAEPIYGPQVAGVDQPFDSTANIYSGKLTFRIGQGTTIVGTVFGDPETRTGALANLTSTNPIIKQAERRPRRGRLLRSDHPALRQLRAGHLRATPGTRIGISCCPAPEPTLTRSATSRRGPADRLERLRLDLRTHEQQQLQARRLPVDRHLLRRQPRDQGGRRLRGHDDVHDLVLHGRHAPVQIQSCPSSRPDQCTVSRADAQRAPTSTTGTTSTPTTRTDPASAVPAGRQRCQPQEHPLQRVPAGQVDRHSLPDASRWASVGTRRTSRTTRNRRSSCSRTSGSPASVSPGTSSATARASWRLRPAASTSRCRPT